MEIKSTIYDINEKFEEICDKASKKCKNLERFPSYFKFKKFETQLIIENSGIIEKGPILEIGCGTGFQSSLLATFCNKIIATDLPCFSQMTHTIGMHNVREMIEKLDIHNIDYLGCSAINLPFKDRSFGCVFSDSVLEHIDDKRAALIEMRRVLKGDGIVVCLIPTYMESIFQFPSLYLYIAKRAFDIVKSKLFRREINYKSIFFKNSNKDSRRNIKELFRAFFNNNPNFPFPQPHGYWKNKKGKPSIFVEFFEQLPWRWNNMFLNSGLKIMNTFSILFIPYGIIEILSPQLLTKVYCGTSFLHRNLANSFLKYFGLSICYVAKKI